MLTNEEHTEKMQEMFRTVKGVYETEINELKSKITSLELKVWSMERETGEKDNGNDTRLN